MYIQQYLYNLEKLKLTTLTNSKNNFYTSLFGFTKSQSSETYQNKKIYFDKASINPHIGFLKLIINASSSYLSLIPLIKLLN